MIAGFDVGQPEWREADEPAVHDDARAARTRVYMDLAACGWSLDVAGVDSSPGANVTSSVRTGAAALIVTRSVRGTWPGRATRTS